MADYPVNTNQTDSEGAIVYSNVEPNKCLNPLEITRPFKEGITDLINTVKDLTGKVCSVEELGINKYNELESTTSKIIDAIFKLKSTQDNLKTDLDNITNIDSTLLSDLSNMLSEFKEVVNNQGDFSDFIQKITDLQGIKDTLLTHTNQIADLTSRVEILENQTGQALTQEAVNSIICDVLNKLGESFINAGNEIRNLVATLSIDCSHGKSYNNGISVEKISTLDNIIGITSTPNTGDIG